MINIEMWPGLKVGQLIYNLQYDSRKKYWIVVSYPISTPLKTLKDRTDKDGGYKYLIETRGENETRGFKFYLPDEDFFFAEEDAENVAIMYNLRSKMNEMYRISDQVKQED